ncbi:frameshift disrupted ORF, antioxidant, AhpC/Tsa family protein [Francisella tularensis subsp. tularensis WY96-3418]|nr:frameshift disrupted ORF, antioxidant, AhpC/Tsa family protein [Francisella tularensis subsp. tularensis WY96-3418]
MVTFFPPTSPCSSWNCKASTILITSSIFLPNGRSLTT